MFPKAAMELMLKFLAANAPGPIAEEAAKLIPGLAEFEVIFTDVKIILPVLKNMVKEWEEYQARTKQRLEPGSGSGAIAGMVSGSSEGNTEAR